MSTAEKEMPRCLPLFLFASLYHTFAKIGNDFALLQENGLHSPPKLHCKKTGNMVQCAQSTRKHGYTSPIYC